ncbi:MAG: hypothetical protein ACREX3_15445 [Gammaproteobacteria bacterium]
MSTRQQSKVLGRAMATAVGVLLFILVNSGAYAACTRRLPYCEDCLFGGAKAARGVVASYCNYCYYYCFAPLQGDAEEMAQALGGRPYAYAEDGVLLVQDEAQSPEASKTGIDFDPALLSEIAKTHPAAAIVLYHFHPSHRDPLLNLLMGMWTNGSGTPTASTVELIINGADERLIEDSLTPIEPGMYHRIKWEGAETAKNTVRVTFVSELLPASDVDIDSEGLVTHPRTVVLVSKVNPRIISVTHVPSTDN